MDTINFEPQEKTLRDLQREAFNNSSNKGFWDKSPTHADKLATIPEKLCLIHSEVSEALEDYRAKCLKTFVSELPSISGKPLGFPTELADIVIRVMDLCGALDIDLQAEIELKMQYNATRPAMHGKVC